MVFTSERDNIQGSGKHEQVDLYTHVGKSGIALSRHNQHLNNLRIGNRTPAGSALLAHYVSHSQQTSPPPRLPTQGKRQACRRWPTCSALLAGHVRISISQLWTCPIRPSASTSEGARGVQLCDGFQLSLRCDPFMFVLPFARTYLVLLQLGPKRAWPFLKPAPQLILV